MSELQVTELVRMQVVSLLSRVCAERALPILLEKARTSGVPQEIGPLNAYERRIVHLAVAELPGASSESIGDASVKTVVITAA